MFVVGNLFLALAKIVDAVLILLYWLVLIRALISWVSPDPSNPVVQFLYRTTEPVLAPVRRWLPAMAIDLSPIVVFLAIMFARSFVVRTLVDLGYRLQS